MKLSLLKGISFPSSWLKIGSVTVLSGAAMQILCPEASLVFLLLDLMDDKRNSIVHRSRTHCAPERGPYIANGGLLWHVMEPPQGRGKRTGLGHRSQVFMYGERDENNA